MGTVTQFLAYAEAQLGKPYSETLTGGVGPNHYDCSGLVQQAAKAAGLAIARTTQTQWRTSKMRHVASPIVGDVIYFKVPADGGVAPQHVGIYVGPNRMLEAPHSGTVVKYSSIPNSVGESIFGYCRLPFDPSPEPPAPQPTPQEDTMAVSALTSWRSGQVDVFQVSDGTLWHKWELTPGQWSNEAVPATIGVTGITFPVQAPGVTVTGGTVYVTVEDSTGAAWVFAQGQTGGWGANKLP